MAMAVVAVVVGVSLFSLSTLATRTPDGSLGGFPLGFSRPITPCHSTLNPFNGCGFSYDPWIVGVDFVFWVALASIAILLFSKIPTTTRSGTPQVQKALRPVTFIAIFQDGSTVTVTVSTVAS